MKLNSNNKKLRRSKLLGKYMAKILFGWDDKKFEYKKFEDKYLKKLERN